MLKAPPEPYTTVLAYIVAGMILCYTYKRMIHTSGMLHLHRRLRRGSALNTMLLWLSVFFFLAAVAGSMLILIAPRFRAAPLSHTDRSMRWWIIGAAALIIISCTMPMGLSPEYNGEIQSFRNQYEMITEAFLSGQLHFQYKVDERLLALDNPYDMVERAVSGVDFHWDHALYNGHYYMYFGVVPVLLLFLPFRVITGHALTGYHGAQIFTAIYIIGIFMLLRLLGKKFFSKLPVSLYLLFCAAISYLSLWYAVSAPALYCMAIISALACAVWSLYFFAKAVWCCESENRAIALAALGSLLGALEFGCRPTVGLSNLVVLPLILAFLKKRGVSAKLLFKMLLAALPYALVAAGLMWYNAARFGNPFEFGQSYQLTVTDQTAYGDMLSRFDPIGLLRDIYFYLFNNMLSLPALEPLPRIGPFVTFPMLPASFLLLLSARNIRYIHKSKLTLFSLFLLASVVVIITFDVLWAPIPEPRYRLDFSWLLGVAAFVIAGSALQVSKHPKALCVVLGIACILTMIASAVLFLYPYDSNFTYYFGIDFFGALEGIK